MVVAPCRRASCRLLVPTVAIALLTAEAATPVHAGSEPPAATSLVDRAAVDATLYDIAAEYLADTSPTNGAVFDGGECPALGEQSVVDVVGAAGVEIVVRGAEPSGFLHAVPDGLNINCTVTAGDQFVGITIAQTLALDAREFATFNRPVARERVSYDVDVQPAGFSADSVVVLRDSGGAQSTTWVDNGLLVAVALGPAGQEEALADSLAILVDARDAVLETLQGTSDGAHQRAGGASGDLDRRQLVAALGAAVPAADDPGRPQDLVGEPCPVLADDAFVPVAAVLGLDSATTAQRVQLTPGAGFPVHCTFGEADASVTVDVRLARPLSVAEYEAHFESALTDVEASIAPLETASDVLDVDRAAVRDGAGRSAIWINNGLHITVQLPDGADPAATLEAVVPAVLGTLSLA